MADNLLSNDRPVKRHVLADDSGELPFVSMSASTPDEESTLGGRLTDAIKAERHRGSTAVENALMLKYPEVFRSRGFLSSYINGRRGKRAPDPKAIKLIADFLHVEFEWLLLGSGPMRRGARAETAFEQAMFTARDWGIRSDAADVAWERNKDRADSMTVEECFDEIRGEAARLDRAGVPKPEALVATRDDQARIRRAKSKKAKQQGSAGEASRDVPITAPSPKLVAMK